MRMCGRMGLDPEVMWNLMPGEFEDMVAGRVDGEKSTISYLALIASFVAATNGHHVSVQELLGEPAPNHGTSPLEDDAEERAAKFAQARKMARKKSIERAKKWVPRGIKYDVKE